jgi:hypothetical protein
MWAEAGRRFGRSRGWGRSRFRGEFTTEDTEGTEELKKGEGHAGWRAPLLFFGPELGGMEDRKDFYGFAFDFIGDEIWGAGDDEFASPYVASQTPETRIAAQAVNGGDNAFGNG